MISSWWYFFIKLNQWLSINKTATKSQVSSTFSNPPRSVNPGLEVQVFDEGVPRARPQYQNSLLRWVFVSLPQEESMFFLAATRSTNRLVHTVDDWNPAPWHTTKTTTQDSHHLYSKRPINWLVQQYRGHYQPLNPIKALLMGNPSNLPYICIVWCPPNR